MYIRRKVFSKIGEKTFSTTEFQTQKEFAAKKEESKKEKVAKAATIGGATVGLGAGTVGLGAEIGRKKVKKAISKLEMENANIYDRAKKASAGGKAIPTLTKNQQMDIEINKAAQKKLKKADKILEKVSKKGTKAGIAGVGASVAGAVAYKALKKKKDQKEFAEKKKSREDLEKDYKDASKKVQDKAGKAAGILGAATMGSVGASIGTKLGFDAAEKTKKGKKLEKVIDKARDKWAKETVNGSKGAVNSSKRLKKLTDKSLKRGNIAGAIGAGLGAAALGTAGYKMNNAIIKKQIKKGDEKFLKTATDEQLEKATKDINENFGSKKKNKK